MQIKFLLKTIFYLLLLILGVGSFAMFLLCYLAGDDPTKITGLIWFLPPSFLVPLSTILLLINHKKQSLVK